jgi:hypothetical protein
MSREFLRKSLQKEGASINPHASGEERHMALVNRLYASYEKVRARPVWHSPGASVYVCGHIECLGLDVGCCWLCCEGAG